MIPVRVLAAAGIGCGVLAAGVAGAALGGPWWLVAVVAAGGALAGRTGSLVQSVAVLGLVAGAAGTGELWLVPVLVAGVVATVEAGALAERSTGVRPVQPAGVILAPVAAAVVAVAVLWLDDVGPGPAVPLALLAAAGATAALVALRP